MSSATLQEFDVDVCRVGYGFATIKVRAENEFEAQQKALDEAGGHEYSEKDSEYSLSNPVPDPQKQGKSLQLFASISFKDPYQMGSISAAGLRLSVTYSLLDRVDQLQAVMASNSLSEVRFFLGADPIHYASSDDVDDDGSSIDMIEAALLGSRGAFHICASDSDQDVITMQIETAQLRKCLDEGVAEVYLSDGDPIEFAESLQGFTEGEIKRVFISAAGEVENEPTRERG